MDTNRGAVGGWGIRWLCLSLSVGYLWVVRGLSVGYAYRLHPRLCAGHRAAVRIRVYQDVRLCPCGQRPAISYSLYLTQHAHVPIAAIGWDAGSSPAGHVCLFLLSLRVILRYRWIGFLGWLSRRDK